MSKPSNEFSEFSLSPAKVARALGTLALLIVFASTAGQISKYWLGHEELKGFVRLFDLDAEANVATWFSVLLMLISALILAVTAVIERREGALHASKWAVLSMGFLYLGYDEAFLVHEKLLGPMRQLLGGSNLGLLYFAWVVPGTAVVAALGVFFLQFLLHLPRSTRIRFIVASSVYLSGVIGMELLGGMWAEAHGMGNWEFSALVTVEESLEMAGVICFIRALLMYLADKRVAIRLRFLEPMHREAKS